MDACVHTTYIHFGVRHIAQQPVPHNLHCQVRPRCSPLPYPRVPPYALPHRPRAPSIWAAYPVRIPPVYQPQRPCTAQYGKLDRQLCVAACHLYPPGPITEQRTCSGTTGHVCKGCNCCCATTVCSLSQDLYVELYGQWDGRGGHRLGRCTEIACRVLSTCEC